MARIISIEYQRLKSFIVQVEAISLCKLRLFHCPVRMQLCKLRIFPLPFSKKKTGIFKLCIYRAQGYYKNKTQGDCPGL